VATAANSATSLALTRSTLLAWVNFYKKRASKYSTWKVPNKPPTFSPKHWNPSSGQMLSSCWTSKLRPILVSLHQFGFAHATFLFTVWCKVRNTNRDLPLIVDCCSQFLCVWLIEHFISLSFTSKSSEVKCLHSSNVRLMYPSSFAQNWSVQKVTQCTIGGCSRNCVVRLVYPPSDAKSTKHTDVGVEQYSEECYCSSHTVVLHYFAVHETFFLI